MVSDRASGRSGADLSGKIMQESNFDLKLDQILAKDMRYSREAYIFLREALDFSRKLASGNNQEKTRHVTVHKLLEGIRQFALQQFGPMSAMVLDEWGVKSCSDFGEIVFSMAGTGLLEITERDKRADFDNGYDFTEAFQKPFWPQSKSLPKTKTPARRD